MFSATGIDYQMAERSRGLAYSGLGAIQLLVKRTGLAEAIDRKLKLLKRHLPYFESDHVLTLPTTSYATATVWRIWNACAMTKFIWMPWALKGFPTLPPPATSADATRKKMWKP